MGGGPRRANEPCEAGAFELAESSVFCKLSFQLFVGIIRMKRPIRTHFLFQIEDLLERWTMLQV